MLDAARCQRRARPHRGGPRRRRPEPEHLPHREPGRWQSRFPGHVCVLCRGQASKAGRCLHGQGKHLGSRIRPLCVPQLAITGQEAPCTDKRLHEDLYKKVMSGDPVAARLPDAILTKMVTFSGWKRFEMNETQVPRGYGNDVPVDCETISHHQQKGEVCWRTAPREPPPGHAGGTFSCRSTERFRDLTACSGCPVHNRPR